MNATTIGKAARRAGVGVETIRFYERKGIIAQPRRPAGSGYRQYTDDVVSRIRFIRQAQEFGFTLKEIDNLLALKADPASDASQVRERAQRKLDEVERKMVRLTRIASALRTIIDACPATGALSCCSIMNSLTPDPHEHDHEEENLQ